MKSPLPTIFPSLLVLCNLFTQNRLRGDPGHLALAELKDHQQLSSSTMLHLEDILDSDDGGASWGAAFEQRELEDSTPQVTRMIHIIGSGNERLDGSW